MTPPSSGLLYHTGVWSLIDDVSKLDPSNAVQLDLLLASFGHNMLTIDFFLNFCVFPRDTRQFPQRLTANSWHIAENREGAVVGFSGTKDTHRLLPLQVAVRYILFTVIDL